MCVYNLSVSLLDKFVDRLDQQVLMVELPVSVLASIATKPPKLRDEESMRRHHCVELFWSYC
jgi:hypothetical protein